VREYLCRNIRNNVPTDSIILAGSRARGDHHESSDYDLAIVMNVILIPFYLKKINRLESELIDTLGVDINLKPIPSWRIIQPTINPYVLKLRRDGIVLYGKDYIKQARRSAELSIHLDPYWSFYYLFCLMKALIEPYNMQKSDNKSLSRTAVKVIRELKDSPLEIYYRDKSPIEFDQHILNNKEMPLKQWFFARDIVLKYFDELSILTRNSNRLKNIFTGDIKFSSILKSRLKNIQFIFLVLIYRNELRIKPLFDASSVTYKMGFCVMLLLRSINGSNSVDRTCIDDAYNLLIDLADVTYSTDTLSLWNELKIKVSSYWPYAMTTMGI